MLLYANLMQSQGMYWFHTGLQYMLAPIICPIRSSFYNCSPLFIVFYLKDNGELVKMSSMLYAMRVDTTYTDAVATNVQLQPRESIHYPKHHIPLF